MVIQLTAELLSVFYIGHSLVSPTLPEMVQSALDGSVEYQIMNGAPLQNQWEEAASVQGQPARDWLPAHKVDALVLTERVPLAATVEWHDSVGYLRKFLDAGFAGNPQMQPYLYETWHELSGDGADGYAPYLAQIRENLAIWQDLATKASQGNPAGAAKVQIIPAGQGMIRLQAAVAEGQVPGASNLRDFFEDDIHPNNAGFYYVAMIHYAALTQKSPEGLPARLMGRHGPYPAVPAEQASALQKLAWQTVQGYAEGERP